MDQFRDAEADLRVPVEGIWIDETVVTNGAFAKFVETTVYLTGIEQPPTVGRYPASGSNRLALRCVEDS